MTPICRFERIETKYIITEEQKERLLSRAAGRVCGDEYGESRIVNLYFDTPDRRIIRRSLEKPAYKEKLRLRSYGTPDGPAATVFLELKKKYRGVVYKRREPMPYATATDFLKNPAPKTQIEREIARFLSFYPDIQPAMYLAYRREAFFGCFDSGLRLTFDTDIRYREEETELSRGVYGRELLPAGRVLLEIKVGGAMPLWLSEILSEEKIFRTSFSKYGRAYENICKEKRTNLIKTEETSYA